MMRTRSTPRYTHVVGFALLVGTSLGATPQAFADEPAGAVVRPSDAAGTPPDSAPPPPGVGLPPAPVEPGSAPGLVAPTIEERAATVRQYQGGMPEVRVPQYDPTGRFLIPYSGQWGRTDCPLSFFAVETLTYDSNIFASARDVEDDWISNTSVGVTARREGSTFWARGTFSLTYSHYFEHDEQDALNLYGEGQLGWKGGCFYAGIEDRLARLQDTVVVRDDVFLLVDKDLESYWTNTLRAFVGYDGCRLHAELDYSFNLFEAENGPTEAFNNTDHSIGGRVDYYLSDKTSVGAFAGTRFVPFSDSTQDDFNVLTAGATATYRPTEKTGIAAMLGGGWADSDSGDDAYSGVGSIDLSYDPTPCIALAVGWSRAFEPSLGADYQVLDRVYVRAHASVAPFWLLTASTGVQMGDTYNATADGSKDYTLCFLDLMAHRSIGDCFGLDFGYQYRTQDADDNGIDFDQHRLTVGLSFYR